MLAPSMAYIERGGTVLPPQARSSAACSTSYSRGSAPAARGRSLDGTTGERTLWAAGRCQRQRRRQGGVPARSSADTPAAVSNVPLKLDPYEALQGKEVFLVSSQQKVVLTELWGERERAVLFWARTFGCPFCWELSMQLRRELLPALDAAGVRLYLTAIGTPERGLDFVVKTGFPAARLLADPTSSTYAALGLRKGVLDTFFNPATPLALGRRLLAGEMGVLAREVLPQWVPWQPPTQDQALQQGGVVVFHGREARFVHFDVATGVHADLRQVAAAALEGLPAAAAGR